MNKMNQQLELIANASPESRDLLLDDLNDLLQSAPLEEDDAKVLVRDLSRLVDNKDSDAALESLFNVLGTLYAQGRARDEIEDIALKRMSSLPVGATVHALEIVGMSEIPSKRDLLATYTEHENLYLSARAKSLLADTIELR